MSNAARAKNLEAIVKAVRQHDANCTEKGKAVAMCAFEVERLDFDSVPVDGRNVPIIVGENIGSGRFRVICNGYHGPKGDAQKDEETVEAPSPQERELVPSGAPSGDEVVAYAKGLGLKLTPWQEDFFRDHADGKHQVQIYQGPRAGRRWVQETYRRVMAEMFPEVEIEEPIPGMVTYKFPEDW